MAGKTKQKGMIQIYTGDGKGKTTAALGLALRAAGHGMKTFIGQFMKGQVYGELRALQDFPLIAIEQFGGNKCIRREEVTDRDRQRAEQGLQRCLEVMQSGNFNIIVLDEILVALWFGLVSLETVLHLVDNKPAAVELILTGRRAPQELIDRADLVTEMRQVKHYYQQGVPARKGIER